MMRIRLALFVFVFVVAAAGCGPDDSTTPEGPDGAAGEAGPQGTADDNKDQVTAANAPLPQLIPREILFGNPERSGAAISPDGKRVAWIAPLDGVLNVYVAPADDLTAAKAVTADKTRPIRQFQFAQDGKHLLYLQDTGGDENYHVHAVDLDAGGQRDITPFPGARASIAGMSPQRPSEVLLAVNNRNAEYFDLQIFDLASGKRSVVISNDEFADFVVTETFEPRIAIRPLAEGGNEWLIRDGKDWKPWLRVPVEDSLTTAPVGFNAAGTSFYAIDSRGRDKAALVAWAWPPTGEPEVLFESAEADVAGAIRHPITGDVEAASVDYLRKTWHAVDSKFAGDLSALAKIADGDFDVASRTLADDRWIVGVDQSDASYKYYLYDRAAGTATMFVETRPALADKPLVKMHPEQIATRDGLKQVSYLVLPPGSDPDGDGRPAQPVPMVLLPHGGPWGRDSWGFDRMAQWLANRGYAVLMPNFRASTGFGKAFLNAGNLQWGLAMHNDLLDATQWAIDQKIAPADKIAIMGGSYGGYSTLAGVTMSPDTFACGVDIVGPSNLITLLETIPPYWASFRREFEMRMGDPATEEGRALLVAASPLTHVDKIKKPLLIGQGANDPRVKQAESDQIVSAMQAKNIPVTYVLFPDEGHGFARPENSLAFNAVAEQFLAKCLGGRAEPIGDDFAGSSITIPAGADQVPGVAEALVAKATTPITPNTPTP